MYNFDIEKPGSKPSPPLAPKMPKRLAAVKP